MVHLDHEAETEQIKGISINSFIVFRESQKLEGARIVPSPVLAVAKSFKFLSVKEPFLLDDFR
jgi:hypothetical protein